MRKDELSKLYDHIRTKLLRATSEIDVGYQSTRFLEGTRLLYDSNIISYKELTRLNNYIIGVADESIQIINYKRLNNDR